MKPSHIKWFAALILISLPVLAIRLPHEEPQLSPATVSVVSIKNIKGKIHAEFQVRNWLEQEVAVSFRPPEIRAGTNWVIGTVQEDQVCVLASQQIEILSIELPPSVTNSSWRVPVAAYFPPTKPEQWITRLWSNFKDGRNSETFEIASPEMPPVK